jgi:hypothetical protein
MGGIALYTIFVAADNRFGHSAPEVLARYAEQGIPVLRTLVFVMRDYNSSSCCL